MSHPHSRISPEQQALGRRWVLGIILGLSTVVLVNGVVAYIAGSSHAQLERDDYYNASLHHQEVLDAAQRGAQLGYALSYQANQGLRLARAGSPITESVEGRLQMTRPDQAQSDFSMLLSFPLSQTDQAALAHHLRTGRWHASLTLASLAPTTTVNATLYLETVP